MTDFPSAAPASDPSLSGARTHERALVLGGGGAAGNAWEIGLVAGLARAGLDLTDADLLVGTSAGATAAVQLTSGRSPAELLDELHAAPERPRPAAPRGGAGAGPSGADHLARTGAIIAAATDAADMRRRMGAAAIALDPDGAASARWRAVVAGRLAGLDWPDRDLRIAAVDSRTGEPVVFGRWSGVALVDAVAASTSSGAAYRIGDGRYLDGGYRRNENADLAAGSRRVLVCSPFGGRTRHPLAWGLQLSAQVDELLAAGSAVETVAPPSEATHLFGPDAADPALRPAAADAGFAQAAGLAERLAALWR